MKSSVKCFGLFAPPLESLDWGYLISRVWEHLVRLNMKCRHQYPTLDMSNLCCHSLNGPAQSCFYGNSVLYHCVVESLGSALSAFVCAQAALPLDFVVSRPTDALHILWRKFRLIHTWAMTRTSKNADNLKLCCPTISIFIPMAVLECEFLHSCMFSMSQFKAYRCAAHSCLHIWTEELQTYSYFSHPRQGAGGLQQNSQTWVWQTDGHGLTAAHLTLHPLSTVHKPATYPPTFYLYSKLSQLSFHLSISLHMPQCSTSFFQY